MSAGRKHISDKKDWNTPPKYIKLIKKMFDVMMFQKSYPDIDIQKKNPTLLYYPNSLE